MRKLIAVLTTLAATGIAGAAMAADFYAGKTIRLVVSSAPGGGYDAYARTFAQYLKKHIPGEPTIVVQNMPGAGGTVATNWLFNVAPKDGLVFGVIQRGVPFHPFFGEKRAKFVPADFNWLGSFNDETSVVTMWHASRVKTINDAMTIGAVMGGSGPNDSETHTSLMNNTIGTKFKVSSGYKSNTDVMLAMERGEVEGVAGSWGSLKAGKLHWLRDKLVNVIVQVGRAKHADLPNVPMVTEFVKDPEYKAMWTVMTAVGTVGRPVVAPPGLPPELVKILRAGFAATMKDRDYLAEMKKSRREVDPVYGDEVQKILTDVAKVPKSTLVKLNGFIKRK
ncbi:MAG: Bug family tripartite tricarboxylate transporter substrate binding protein [Xanthobacteraceae bacterium]